MSTAAAPIPPDHADSALGLLSLSRSPAIAHPVPSAPVPIPSKPRPRSSFSQAIRRRRPSDARDPLFTHEDRDRAASARLLSKSVPLDEPPVAGKKKGALFRCESCSKVYRHPSCLVKHRWEHSPHWREASKFLLSKHQQVQLLEAAAILSHLSPTAAGGGTSLPEDRSLWPAYLSGGRLPPTLTQFRPGLLGHPNPVSTSADDVWASGTPHTPIDAPFASPTSVQSYHTGYAHRISPGALFESKSMEERGWSLPRSSVRGGESDDDGSGSRMAMEDVDDAYGRHGRNRYTGQDSEPEEWDGMEMEMEI